MDLAEWIDDTYLDQNNPKNQLTPLTDQRRNN